MAFQIKYRCTNCQSVFDKKHEAIECCAIQEVFVCPCGRSYALKDLAEQCLASHSEGD